ncbi:hypothetical protein HK100_008597 [Physocladia obscura]|uniref:RCC1-like domain-containing protein n=1 Tax=Physocladia obscura TaxID=109957 RepID=A0AAD5T442_9FUNG|nr:hypothetical protein HK100_008597 [Physocladia obscura]
MKLFACGSNVQGQLGTGGLDDSAILLPVPVPLLLSDIVSLSCGANHTLGLTRGGQLIGCGRGVTTFGQIQLLTNNDSAGPVEKTSRIEQVVCGFETSLVRFEEGSVWRLKLDTAFNGSEPQYKATVTRLNVPQHSVKVLAACAKRFAAIMSNDNENTSVYIWDDTSIPTFKITDPSSLSSPPNFNLFDRNESIIVAVAIGLFHSLVLTKSGSIFSIGSHKRNKFAQLGFISPPTTVYSNETITTRVLLPTPQTDLVVSIQSGWSHCAAMLKSGTCVMWGRQDLAQIPNTTNLTAASAPASKCILPTVIPLLKNARKLTLGPESAIAILSTGRIVSWGWNEHGNCGVGHIQNVQLDSDNSCRMKISSGIVDDVVPSHVFCGYGHAFVLFDTGEEIEEIGTGTSFLECFGSGNTHESQVLALMRSITASDYRLKINPTNSSFSITVKHLTCNDLTTKIIRSRDANNPSEGPHNFPECLSCNPDAATIAECNYPGGEAVRGPSTGIPPHLRALTAADCALPPVNKYTKTWIDAQSRPIVIVTPCRHVFDMRQLSDCELIALWQAVAQAVSDLGGEMIQIVLNAGVFRNIAHMHVKIYFEKEVFFDSMKRMGMEMVGKELKELRQLMKLPDHRS